MSTVVCKNLECKYISKRRTKFLSGKNEEILCHTCRKPIISIGPLCGSDEHEEDVYGYIPHECLNSTTKC